MLIIFKSSFITRSHVSHHSYEWAFRPPFVPSRQVATSDPNWVLRECETAGQAAVSKCAHYNRIVMQKCLLNAMILIG